MRNAQPIYLNVCVRLNVSVIVYVCVCVCACVRMCVCVHVYNGTLSSSHAISNVKLPPKAGCLCFGRGGGGGGGGAGGAGAVDTPDITPAPLLCGRPGFGISQH